MRQRQSLIQLLFRKLLFNYCFNMKKNIQSFGVEPNKIVKNDWYYFTKVTVCVQPSNEVLTTDYTA